MCPNSEHHKEREWTERVELASARTVPGDKYQNSGAERLPTHLNQAETDRVSSRGQKQWEPNGRRTGTKKINDIQGVGLLRQMIIFGYGSNQPKLLIDYLGKNNGSQMEGGLTQKNQ